MEKLRLISSWKNGFKNDSSKTITELQKPSYRRIDSFSYDYSQVTVDMLLGLEPVPASLDVIEGEIVG